MTRISRRAFIAGTAATAFAPLAARYAGGAEPSLRLVAAPGTAPLAAPEFPDTAVWSYGAVPGPEIRVRRGTRVRVLLENRLPEPTTVHWHGIRIANAMDGVPDLTQAPVPPGESFAYDFVAPDAGTFWYHSHFRSYEQVARGLYGPLIVEEDAGAPVADREVTVLVDDWRLEETGQIHTASFGAMMDASHGGRIGNWLTVNGKSEEMLPARSGERLRLRLICASNARIMQLDLAGLKPRLVALDGWPLAEPRTLDGPLEMAPAQRADVIVDMPKGRGDISVYEVSAGDRVRALTFSVDGPAVEPGEYALALPAPAAPRLDLAGARRIPLVMEGGAMGPIAQMRHQGRPVDVRQMVRLGLIWAFNGELRTPEEPLAEVRLGETVVIEMVNRTAWPHAMHLHGHHMAVVGRGGKPVADDARRDTVLTQPDERLDLAFVADNPGKWLFHCHMLEHAMSGMSTWIGVA